MWLKRNAFLVLGITFVVLASAVYGLISNNSNEEYEAAVFTSPTGVQMYGGPQNTSAAGNPRSTGIPGATNSSTASEICDDIYEDGCVSWNFRRCFSDAECGISSNCAKFTCKTNQAQQYGPCGF